MSSDYDLINLCCECFCILCMACIESSSSKNQRDTQTNNSRVYTINDESGISRDPYLISNANPYNTGPAYMPYMPSAPPIINSNSNGTEVVNSQPLRSDLDIIFGSDSTSSRITSTTLTQNEPLTPPPKYESLFP